MSRDFNTMVVNLFVDTLVWIPCVIWVSCWMVQCLVRILLFSCIRSSRSLLREPRSELGRNQVGVLKLLLDLRLGMSLTVFQEMEKRRSLRDVLCMYVRCVTVGYSLPNTNADIPNTQQKQKETSIFQHDTFVSHFQLQFRFAFNKMKSANKTWLRTFPLYSVRAVIVS